MQNARERPLLDARRIDQKSAADGRVSWRRDVSCGQDEIVRFFQIIHRSSRIGANYYYHRNQVFRLGLVACFIQANGIWSMTDSDEIISTTGGNSIVEDQNVLRTSLQLAVESAGENFANDQCGSGRDTRSSRPQEGFDPLTGAPKSGHVGNFVFLRMMI